MLPQGKLPLYGMLSAGNHQLKGYWARSTMFLATSQKTEIH